MQVGIGAGVGIDGLGTWFPRGQRQPRRRQREAAVMAGQHSQEPEQRYWGWLVAVGENQMSIYYVCKLSMNMKYSYLSGVSQ